MATEETHTFFHTFFFYHMWVPCFSFFFLSLCITTTGGTTLFVHTCTYLDVFCMYRYMYCTYSYYDCSFSYKYQKFKICDYMNKDKQKHKQKDVYIIFKD